ncbi:MULTISPECIES: MerR family transcriptional regulator [Paenibacillus]|jgi:DNA-binding transcriptional MerR regulator|uniref:MerR family transcriptional regulator n=2 Tax=Paenibacillus TaxID=44249 RepID=A0ABX1XJF4_9BACL|nr:MULTISPECIES: MerR family transcriptional regulator [Paenibacillus]NOU67985.1 MerR family transcriptional regulator [Paenibacillus plantarum]NQX57824.1 MerR family transcriptional regulator [Paenibacillus qinlingensis]CAH1219706.1 HTH-type transcriptional regulator TnrA [Paenibacillus allorhizoplanae]
MMTKKKVIQIGIVSELTGLTERQIRYYEDRKLIFPDRSKGGVRKYSFEDIQTIMDIHTKLTDGFHTVELRRMLAGS